MDNFTTDIGPRYEFLLNRSGIAYSPTTDYTVPAGGITIHGISSNIQLTSLEIGAETGQVNNDGFFFEGLSMDISTSYRINGTSEWLQP